MPRNNHRPSATHIKTHFGYKADLVNLKVFVIPHRYRKYIKMRNKMALKSRRINRKRAK